MGSAHGLATVFLGIAGGFLLTGMGCLIVILLGTNQPPAVLVGLWLLASVAAGVISIAWSSLVR